MDVVRSALLVVVCVLAIGGTVLFFGSGPSERTPDETAITGRWSGDALDRARVASEEAERAGQLGRADRARIDLELGDAGRYALVVGTGGGVECGKWRVDRGSLQMRAKNSAGMGSTLLMTQPGFRAGTFKHAGEQLDVSMQSALPGARSRAERWALTRSEGTLLAGCR